MAVAAFFAVHGAVSGAFATRIPWIQEHVHAGPGALGVALLAPAVGSLVAMPMAGRLLHRFGGRPVTRLLLALWCVVVALPPLAPDLAVLWVTLLVYGASAGMCDVAMNAQAVVVEQRTGRSIMSGMHGMWSAGGLVAGSLGVAAAQAGLDARVHLAGTAVLTLAVGAVAGRWLLAVRPEPGAVEPPMFVLPSRSVLFIGVVGFCAIFGEAASQDWCAVFLKRVIGSSPGVAAACYTAFAFTMTLARLSGDAAVRRLGPVLSVRAGGVVATCGGLLVTFAHVEWVAVAGFMLIGLGVAVAIPLAFAAAGNAANSPGEGVAGVATLSYSSGLVAPAIIGGIAAASSLRVSFGVVTALGAAMVLAAPALSPARRRPHASHVPARSSAD